MQILSRTKDSIGKWRVLVDLGNGSTQTFKFKKNPKDAEVTKAVEKYNDSIVKFNKKSKKKRLSQIDAEIVKLQELKTQLEQELL
jgi:hypothetical protein